MKKLQSLLLSLGAFLSPLSLLAHEGHGIVENGPAHYLFSPEHLLPALILAAGGLWLGRKMMQLGNPQEKDLHA